MTPLAPDLSSFLQKYLPHERGASQHTIAAYAHAFSLLLRFAATRLKRQPSDLAIEHENGGAKLVHGSGGIVLLRAA